MIISPRTRIILIIVLIASGFVSMMLNLPPLVTFVQWFAAIMLIFSYLLFGSVNGALFLLKTGQVNRAEEFLIKGTYKVGWLLKSHRADYYFTKGLIGLYKSQDNETGRELYLNDGEESLLKSLEIGLGRKQERAMAYLNLAHVAFTRKDKAKVQSYLEGLQKNKTSDLQLQKKIEEMELALSKME